MTDTSSVVADVMLGESVLDGSGTVSWGMAHIDGNFRVKVRECRCDDGVACKLGDREGVGFTAALIVDTYPRTKVWL